MATATKKQEQFTFNSYERNVQTQIIHASWIPLFLVIIPTIIFLKKNPPFKVLKKMVGKFFA